jgi:hypothetical protein
MPGSDSLHKFWHLTGHPEEQMTFALSRTPRDLIEPGYLLGERAA